MKPCIQILHVCVACLLALLGVFAVSPFASASPSGGPSWSDPQGLCGAIVYMPTKGWHNGGDIFGWYCISALGMYGADGPRGLPSTFQYSVTGSGYHKATKIKLWYNANNPRTHTSSLRQLALYAKALSNNIAFKLSDAQLGKIKEGKLFSATRPYATIKFTMRSGRIPVYTLSFSKK